MQSPSVAVIVLNYCQYELTSACLRSLGAVTYPNLRVVVVDNQSNESRAIELRAQFPAVTVLALEENRGVAGGRNAGIRFSLDLGVDYVLFLDNDTEVAPDSVDHLVKVAEGDVRVGAVGPKVYYHPTVCDPNTLHTMAGVMWHAVLHRRSLGHGEVDGGQWDSCQEADWLSGCCHMTQRAVFDRVGLLDEDYSPYGCEDVDWGMRLRAAGYGLRLVPEAVIWHKDLGRFKQTPMKHYYLNRSDALFLRKHARGPQSILPWVFFAARLAKRCFACIGDDRPGIAWRILVGAWTGLIEPLHDPPSVDSVSLPRAICIE